VSAETHKSQKRIHFRHGSTAYYWLALYIRLWKEGYRVVVLNPIQTSAMREVLMQDEELANLL